MGPGVRCAIRLLLLRWSSLRLVALPHTQGALFTRLAGEISGPLRARRTEARFKCVSVQFVDTEMLLPFGRSVNDFIINRLWLLGRVHRNLRLHYELPSDRDGELIPFADTFGVWQH